MISVSERDWMEWQAGYVCGAMLIPREPLVSCVMKIRKQMRLEHAAISEQSQEGLEMVSEVAKSFQTSRDAARVRLLQKNVLNSGQWETLL